MTRALSPADLRCPLSGKSAYPTEDRAAAAVLRAVRAIEDGEWEDVHGRPPVRAYLCECGWWHMTSRPGRAGSSA